MHMHMLTSMPLTADSQSAHVHVQHVHAVSHACAHLDALDRRQPQRLELRRWGDAARLAAVGCGRCGFKGEGDHVKASRLLGFKGRLKVQAGGVLTVG